MSSGTGLSLAEFFGDIAATIAKTQTRNAEQFSYRYARAAGHYGLRALDTWDRLHHVDHQDE